MKHLLFLFLISTNAYSLELGVASLNFGPQLSLNYSQLKHDYSDGDRPKKTYKLSWGIGLNTQLDLYKFSFDLGILYANRVSNFSSSMKGIDLQYTFHQLEFPLIANYEISLVPTTSLRLGIGAAYWMGLGKVKRDNSSLGALSSGGSANSQSYDYLGFSKSQFVGLLNLGVKLDLSVIGIFVFDLRYHHPFSNRAKASNLKSVQNRSFDLSAAYLF